MILADEEQAREVTPGYVAIAGGSIVAVGAGKPESGLGMGARVLDAEHMAVMPGMVNAHTHLSQTFLRGLADDRPLLRWLREIIWPAQAALTPEDMYLAALLGLVENLRCGATTVVQHQKLPGRQHMAATARAAEQLGVRLVLARGWADLGPGGEPAEQILDNLAWLHDEWHGAAAGRIRAANGPMTPWRCSDAALRSSVALARAWGLPTHIHVAEAANEIELLQARCGKRHVEWLAALGCLGPDLQLVHAVHLSEDELDLVAQARATVIYCPTSNMYLASGAARVPAMLQRGIRVVLGTDGPGSNNSQDLLECAKIGALLAKHAAGDAQAVLPDDIMRMLRGAPAGQAPAGATSGRPAGLCAGAPADVILVDLNSARSQPVHRAISAIVYNASGADVRTVVVDGRILIDDGHLTVLDEKALLEECRAAARALVRRAGIA